MILIVSDEFGESIYDNVIRAGFDKTKRVVNFFDPAEPRVLSVFKGTVSVVDKGVTVRKWVATGEPPKAEASGMN